MPNTDNVIVTPLTGWGQGFFSVTLADEALAGLPASARTYAARIIRSGDTPPTADEIIRDAREMFRDEVRNRRGNQNREQQEKERAEREAHRRKTAENFRKFTRERGKDTEIHIGKLPFVPHGLASSRRWGIEIETGAARGIEAPDDWDAKHDGSLRSAYDGYVEVQDFEPYDEERTEHTPWVYCDNMTNHRPDREEYSSERREYIRVPNPDYVSPLDCDSCGNITRTVRVEPQTIHHTARGGDCMEFVSPILVSMHSNGLEYLMKELEGRPVTSSAGIHVHVEADDLTNEQIATMVYGYDMLETILEASYQRERRDFCERRDAEEVLSAARTARRDGSFRPDGGGRYRTLNTHSLSDHGTLEFRAMGPVYDYEYLVRWAMLCRELVNSVANGATTADFAKIKDWGGIVSLIARFGKEFIRAAVYEMTGEKGQQATLSKGGEPVSQSAVDADLESILTGAVEVDANLRRWIEQANAEHLVQVQPSYTVAV